jgi:uncharacterized membrane protein
MIRHRFVFPIIVIIVSAVLLVIVSYIDFILIVNTIPFCLEEVVAISYVNYVFGMVGGV